MGVGQKEVTFALSLLGVLGIWWLRRRSHPVDHVDAGRGKLQCRDPAVLKGPATEHLAQPIVFQDHLTDALRTCDHAVKPRVELVVPHAVSVIHNLLSVQECACLIQAATERGFEPPPLFAAEVRGCKRRHTVDPGMSEFMMARLRPYLPEQVVMDGARWQLDRFTHHWRYVRYNEKGGFIPHWDGSKMLPNHSMSVFTVQIYLNDNFTGGSTRFYADYKAKRLPSHDVKYGEAVLINLTAPPTHIVKAETGAVLMFNHAGRSMLHDGEVVTNGPKYILRGDVLYRAVPEDIPLLLKNDSCHDWCAKTAARKGTRNYIGQVWICWCAVDGAGSDCLHCDISKTDMKSPERLASATPIIVLISGKRCAGKDHVASLLHTAIEKQGLRVHRAAIGDANKKLYAEKMGIDLQRLKNDREFKEQHRIAMIAHHSECNQRNPVWSEEMVVSEALKAQAEVLLVSDIRTLKGLEYFSSLSKPHVLRVHASDDARRRRGWVPDAVKDSLHTEVELDNYMNWDACVDNSDDSPLGAELLEAWINYTVLPRVLR